MTGGSLAVPGGALAWESTGVGTPIVLVHGFALTRAMWDDILPDLAAHHRVVRYDIRGFGDSAAFDAGVPYSHSEDLLALLDRLGIQQTALVGFSFGGQIALLTAIAAPERISALVLVDALLDEVPWDPASLKALKQVIASANSAGPEGGRAAWLHHPLFAVAMARPDLARRIEAMAATYPGQHWVGKDSARPVNPHAVDMLERVTVPTTVVIGERDVPGFITMSDILARDIKGARVVRIPGTGHVAPMEAPAAVVSAIEAALAAQR